MNYNLDMANRRDVKMSLRTRLISHFYTITHYIIACSYHKLGYIKLQGGTQRLEINEANII